MTRRRVSSTIFFLNSLIVAAIISGVLIVLSLKWYLGTTEQQHHQARLRTHGVATIATVEKAFVVFQWCGKTSCDYALVNYHFITMGGRPEYIQQKLPIEFSKLTPGTSLPVHFDPANPSDALPDKFKTTYWDVWMGVILFLAFAALAGTISFNTWKRYLKERKSKP